jgi:hypothetical protein
MGKVNDQSLKTIFCRVMNRMNRRSVGEEGIVPYFSSFGGGAKAWYRDGGGMAREVEQMDPLVQMGDGELQCSQARKSPQPFCGGFRDPESVPMSLDGRNHHGQES